MLGSYPSGDSLSITFKRNEGFNQCAGWVTHEFVHFLANEHTMARLATAGLAGRDLSIVDLDEVRKP